MLSIRDLLLPFGRLRRRYFLIAVLGCYVLHRAGTLLAAHTDYIAVATVLVCAAVWIHVTTFVNRMHDTGRKAWPLMLIPVPAILGVALSGVAQPGPINSSIVGIAMSMLIYFCFLIKFGLADDEKCANRFGPNPRPSNSVDLNADHNLAGSFAAVE
jgi:uncharacterized membrane protein YhaH (DUF805 family)